MALERNKKSINKGKKRVDTTPSINLDAVTIKGKASELLKLRREYQANNNIDKYIEDRFNNPVGREKITKIAPEKFKAQLKQEYLKNRDDEVARKLLDRTSEHRTSYEGRLGRYNSYTDREREVIQNSKYAGKFLPAERAAKQQHLENAKKMPLSVEMFAEQAKGGGENFRVLTGAKNKVEDYVNPFLWGMMEGVGSAPKDVQDGNYGKAAMSVATPLFIGATAGLGAKTTGQFANNLVNPLSFLRKPTKETVDFSKYLTQEGAVQARAERMLSQESKWVGQDNPTLIGKFKNAVKNHDPASTNINPNVGGTNDLHTTKVAKDAVDANGMLISEANKSRVAAHETGHYYRNSAEEAIEWNKNFKFNDKKVPYDEINYLKGDPIREATTYVGTTDDGVNMFTAGKIKTKFDGDELRERAAQLKDHIAHKSGIPLNQDFTITKPQLSDAIKNYVKETGNDNNMSSFLSGIISKGELLKTMNKYPLSVIPAALGIGAASQINNNNMKTEEYSNGGTIQYAGGGVNRYMVPAEIPTNQEYFELPFNALAAGLANKQKIQDENVSKMDTYAAEFMKLNAHEKDKQDLQNIQNEYYDKMDNLYGTDLSQNPKALRELTSGIRNDFGPQGRLSKIQNQLNTYNAQVAAIDASTISSDLKTLQKQALEDDYQGALKSEGNIYGSVNLPKGANYSESADKFVSNWAKTVTETYDTPTIDPTTGLWVTRNKHTNEEVSYAEVLKGLGQMMKGDPTLADYAKYEIGLRSRNMSPEERAATDFESITILQDGVEVPNPNNPMANAILGATEKTAFKSTMRQQDISMIPGLGTGSTRSSSKTDDPGYVRIESMLSILGEDYIANNVEVDLNGELILDAKEFETNIDKKLNLFSTDFEGLMEGKFAEKGYPGLNLGKLGLAIELDLPSGWTLLDENHRMGTVQDEKSMGILRNSLKSVSGDAVTDEEVFKVAKLINEQALAYNAAKDYKDQYKATIMDKMEADGKTTEIEFEKIKRGELNIVDSKYYKDLTSTMGNDFIFLGQKIPLTKTLDQIKEAGGFNVITTKLGKNGVLPKGYASKKGNAQIDVLSNGILDLVNLDLRGTSLGNNRFRNDFTDGNAIINNIVKNFDITEEEFSKLYTEAQRKGQLAANDPNRGSSLTSKATVKTKTTVDYLKDELAKKAPELMQGITGFLVDNYETPEEYKQAAYDEMRDKKAYQYNFYSCLSSQSGDLTADQLSKRTAVQQHEQDVRNMFKPINYGTSDKPKYGQSAQFNAADMRYLNDIDVDDPTATPWLGSDNIKGKAGEKLDEGAKKRSSGVEIVGFVKGPDGRQHFGGRLLDLNGKPFVTKNNSEYVIIDDPQLERDFWRDIARTNNPITTSDYVNKLIGSGATKTENGKEMYTGSGVLPDRDVTIYRGEDLDGNTYRIKIPMEDGTMFVKEFSNDIEMGDFINKAIDSQLKNTTSTGGTNYIEQTFGVGK